MGASVSLIYPTCAIQLEVFVLIAFGNFINKFRRFKILKSKVLGLNCSFVISHMSLSKLLNLLFHLSVFSFSYLCNGLNSRISLAG